MKRISVVPHWSEHWGNRIFTSDNPTADVAALMKWRAVAQTEGFQIDTFDICPPQNADGIWMVDFPRNRSFFDHLLRIKQQAAKIVLQVLESPLLVLQSQSRRDQMECDYILTYGKIRPNDPKFYHYKIPNYLEMEDSGIPFSARRCMVMINSNKREGWFGSGIVDSRRFRGGGRYLNRWKIPLVKRLFPAQGELYSWRRALAREAEKTKERVLDVYGRGWTGEYTTWIPTPRPAVYQCAVGDLRVDPEKTKIYPQKIPLIGHYRFGIAAENYRGHTGYTSEKLWDVMRAGAVPIYLGDTGIADVLPADSFVDVRNFSSQADLIRYVVNCPESEWESMRERGRAFLTSPAAEQFGVNAFVETALKILRMI